MSRFHGIRYLTASAVMAGLAACGQAEQAAEAPAEPAPPPAAEAAPAPSADANVVATSMGRFDHSSDPSRFDGFGMERHDHSC